MMANIGCRMHADSDGPGPSQVREALSRILANSRFRAGLRLANFLRFVVEATLVGNAHRLKGYTIGVAALARGRDFDPQTDPIVRVEATRLRRALARYYDNEGAGDPVVIELLRGSYVPRFHWRSGTPPPPAWRKAVRAVQRVLKARLVLQMGGK